MSGFGMGIARSAYASTLIEETRRAGLPVERLRTPISTAGPHPLARHADDHRRGRARGHDSAGDSMPGVAIVEGMGGPRPSVVRQRGVVESVTEHVITIRCEGGFAEAYVLIDEFGRDGRNAAARLDETYGAEPSFANLRPGDEVIVTSWPDLAEGDWPRHSPT